MSGGSLLSDDARLHLGTPAIPESGSAAAFVGSSVLAKKLWGGPCWRLRFRKKGGPGYERHSPMTSMEGTRRCSARTRVVRSTQTSLLDSNGLK